MITNSNTAVPGRFADPHDGTAPYGAGTPRPRVRLALAAAALASLVAVGAATMPAGTGGMAAAAPDWQIRGTASRLGMALDLAAGSEAGEGAALRYAAGEGATLHAAAGDAGEGATLHAAAGDAGEGASLHAAAGDAGEGTALHYAAGEGAVLHA